MKLFNYTKYTLLFFALFSFVQCSDDETPELINEEEEINRIVIDITSENGSNTYTWNEGDSNFAMQLNSGINYTVAVSFYNASDPNDVEAINPEVIEEADEHHVFFENSSSILTINSASSDQQDSSGNPLGLKTTWTAERAGSATIRLFLIHEPNTKSGNTRSDFGGETDVQLDINVTVE